MELNKLSFFFKTLIFYFKKQTCPYCKQQKYKTIDRKYVLSRLVKCCNCNLQFRIPTDTLKSNKKFYQKNYKEKGLTTDLPTINDLQTFIKNDFKDSEKDASFHIAIIEKIINKSNIKIVDYGANWGYTTYQFIKAGFHTQSYEISKSRSNYGNQNLRLNIKSHINEIDLNNDCFYTSHVIEHVPDLAFFFKAAKRLLTKTGMVYILCPNGSIDFRKKHPALFSKLWGYVHPNFISADFVIKNFKKNPFFISSYPYDIDAITSWDTSSQQVNHLNGTELMIILFPNKSINN